MITLRPARLEDIAAVLTLWRESAEPSSTDDATALTGLLEHDPGALILGESSGQIVGSVIAAWDGWRGTIYRLAVAPAHRGGGLGTRLLQAAVQRISAHGARRLQATVIETDARAMGFWRRTDWRRAEEQTRFTWG
ncbi:MAG TPA: GNAT family N-acetyltransferase [Acidimicrobiales bacterium]|nr:GNAT family N-acetyltransferase [Acidimicrobiales bacterium]